MSKRALSIIAVIFAAFGVFTLAGVVYLAFVFPKTMEQWEDQGRALSGVDQTLASLSNLCESFWLLVIPVLLMGIVGCGVWAVLAGARNRQVN